MLAGVVVKSWCEQRRKTRNGAVAIIYCYLATPAVVKPSEQSLWLRSLSSNKAKCQTWALPTSNNGQGFARTAPDWDPQPRHTLSVPSYESAADQFRAATPQTIVSANLDFWQSGESFIFNPEAQLLTRTLNQEVPFQVKKGSAP